jgi:hypothetical protein
MEYQNIKNYQFVIGSGLVIVGILIFSFLSDSVRYFGFVFIIGAVLYFININLSKTANENNDDRFRSRTRDEILRHQHRTHK